MEEGGGGGGGGGAGRITVVNYTSKKMLFDARYLQL